MKKHGMKLHPNNYKANTEFLEFDKNARLLPWFKNLPKIELVDVYATVGVAVIQANVGAIVTASLAGRTQDVIRYALGQLQENPRVVYLADTERQALQPTVTKQANAVYRKETQ